MTCLLQNITQSDKQFLTVHKQKHSLTCQNIIKLASKQARFNFITTVALFNAPMFEAAGVNSKKGINIAKLNCYR